MSDRPDPAASLTPASDASGPHLAAPPRSVGVAQARRLLAEIEAANAAMTDAGTGGVDALLARAFALWTLGATEAARADARRACVLDPAHVPALLLAARLGDDAQALTVLGHPVATLQERRAAARSLRRVQAGQVLATRMQAALRLTILWDESAPYDVAGLSAEDPFVVLGQSQVEGRKVVVADHILLRGVIARQVTFCFDNDRQVFEVPPLPAVDDAPVDPEKPAAAPWIIVPVYNAPEATARCLTSVLAEMDTVPGARLMLVDDASSDPGIDPLRDRVRRHPRGDVLERRVNGGFTAAVNDGLRSCGPGPVWLLNADTEVPQGTLRRMMRHLSEPDVATVTPLSNNGGSFSIPVPGGASALPDPDQTLRICAEAARLYDAQSADMLTGNGFAMLVSEQARLRFMPLSDHYDSGYYEEVDFCLRASGAGLRHLAALDCFVAHEGAQSYGAARRQLTALNQKRLYHRFPHYPGSYALWRAVSPMERVGKRILSGAGWQPTRAAPMPAPPPEPVLLAYDGPALSPAHRAVFDRLAFCPAAALPADARPHHRLEYSGQDKMFRAFSPQGAPLGAVDRDSCSPAWLRKLQDVILGDCRV